MTRKKEFTQKFGHLILHTTYAANTDEPIRGEIRGSELPKSIHVRKDREYNLYYLEAGYKLPPELEGQRFVNERQAVEAVARVYPPK